MIISRAVSLFLRFAEFVCAAIVLGILAYWIHQVRDVNGDPRGRDIYTLVVSVLGVLAALALLIPTTSSFMHAPVDLIFSALWFAAFGLLVQGLNNDACGGTFQWGVIRAGGFCGQYRAAEAFSFLAAIFWFTSFLLSLWVARKAKSGNVVVADGHRSRRRWGRRSAV
ncbi:integral membrane protein [Pseudovirgaria hyperparasitica]|uniref:Integral membrane protein n=1 Tax=Pseudovirgaria hyperparasitica TaxID=470096 RepID=A0A6A6WCQ8_9PEZI|nr:uncharacterized protein EJ05DRAFT_304908 [Pseudovirgaria hyperparasitica]KAF2759636.1 integral membrane protein [Pseudovirgaria hyperparasitica]